MTVATTTPDTGIRVDELRTKRAVARAFFAQGSPRVITSAVAVALAVRLGLGAGSWGWADAFVVAATAAVVGPVEWVIHRYLLHAPADAWTSRRLGTGAGHRRHHLDPPAVEWLLLQGRDARVFALVVAVATVAWSVPALAVFGLVVVGQAVLAPVATAVLAAYAALWHYEWTHLLVHTRYRPRTPYYRRLARNHRRHHYRNEQYWLGITSEVGDRVLGTYRADGSSVPLSATARNLA